MLTPADIEQRTFSTALRGYDLDEVDDFLDEVATTLRDLYERLEIEHDPSSAEAESAEPVAEPEIVLEPAPAAETEPPVVDESAIGRVLVTAQETADRLIETAQAEADGIVEEARGEADGLKAAREAERLAAQAEIDSIKNRVASVRTEVVGLAGEVSEKLDQMDDVLDQPVDEVESNDEPTGDHKTDDGGMTDDDESPSDDSHVGNDDAASGGDEIDEILSEVANDLRLEVDGEESEEEDS